MFIASVSIESGIDVRTTGSKHLPICAITDKNKWMRCRNKNCTAKRKFKCSECNIFLCITAERHCFVEFLNQCEYCASIQNWPVRKLLLKVLSCFATQLFFSILYILHMIYIPTVNICHAQQKVINWMQGQSSSIDFASLICCENICLHVAITWEKRASQ